jgi:hypothetical protein
LPRDRSSSRLAALAAAALVAVAAAVLIVVLSASSVPGPPALHGRKIGPISIFEADTQLDADPVGTLRLMRSLGIDRVRVFVPWGALYGGPSLAPNPTSRAMPVGFDPTNPAAYSATAWSLYDAIDRAAAQTGVGLYFSLGPPPPLWASGRGAPRPDLPQWRPSAQAFGAFVHAIGVRYSGTYVPPGASTPLPRINFWGIWNEPNYGVDLAPQAIDGWRVEVSPATYRGMLDAAWSALQATGHGGDTILIGELAPRGVQASDGLTPLRFLRALYCVDGSFRPLRGESARLRGCPTTAAGSNSFRARHPALFRASGLAIHPYPQGLPPNYVTPGEPGYADLPAIPRLERTLDTIQRAYGPSSPLPIYNTEFGYKTNPPFPGGVSPRTAAAYLNWAEYISWRDPRIKSYDQYLLTDPACLTLSCFATGLETENGDHKPSYAAFRMPVYLPVTTFTPGQALEVWGCVRPARFAMRETGRHQIVEIEFKRAGSRTWSLLSSVTITDPNGYFDVARTFHIAGSVRLAWRYPHGRRIFSRTVALTTH